MANAQAAGDYIRRVAGSVSDDARQELQLAVELYDRKLWHELTELCLKLSTTALKTDPELYTSFVIHFQKNVNRVSLIQILINLVNYAFDPAKQPEAALDFLRTSTDPDLTEILKESPDALILYHSLGARLYLHASKTEDAREQLEKAKDLVDATYDLEAIAHASFYRATALYHKVMGPAADFYKYGLLFLAYIAPDSLTDKEKNQWAFDIAVAALVGEDIFTFEEVLRNALVQNLGQGENAWIIELMKVINDGDVAGYAKVRKKYGKVMDGQEALVANKNLLDVKSKILGLVALGERKDGSITFEEIKQCCKVDQVDVELLVMKALSLGLITGAVDGVEEVLQVDKIRPRLLDQERCGEMAKRLEVWRKNVTDISNFMESESGPLIKS